MKKLKVYLDNCCFNRPFDYTKWREDLYEGMSARELSRKAKKYADEN